LFLWWADSCRWGLRKLGICEGILFRWDITAPLTSVDGLWPKILLWIVGLAESCGPKERLGTLDVDVFYEKR